MYVKFPLLLALTIFLNGSQLDGQNRITIHIPTAESESEYIWSNIQDIEFFEANNYQVSLPQGSIIEELKQKAKSKQLSDSDYARLESFVKDSVYKKSDYLKGYEKIELERPLLNKMINELSQSNFNWEFKAFETYQVNLTLYGPGGSYNPDEGSILIYTTPEGKFKNYANPSNTLIHEVVHIGIEETIVAKYNVPHTLKERIVDTFVSLYFSQYLPNYRIQDMGESRTDKHLKTKTDLEHLDKIVELTLNK